MSTKYIRRETPVNRAKMKATEEHIRNWRLWLQNRPYCERCKKQSPHCKCPGLEEGMNHA